MTDEIVNFGVSSHDDCVDALVWRNGLMTRENESRVLTI